MAERRKLLDEPTEWAAPIIGDRPAIYEDWQHPFVLDAKLRKPELNPVNGGPFFDAVSQLLTENPTSATRIGEIFLRKIGPGVIGSVGNSRKYRENFKYGMPYKNNGININPQELGQSGLSPIDVLRHELAHMLGYGEEEARSLHPAPRGQ